MENPTYIPEGYYYTKSQVADLFDVPRTTVQRWISHNQLPALLIADTVYFINANDVATFSPPPMGRPPKADKSLS